MAQNLGKVTAYGYAKAGGYTGTEAQFTTMMGNLDDDATSASASATAAAQSANNASQSATDATNAKNTVINAIGEAISIETRRFEKKYTVSSSTSSFTFNPSGYTYSDGDRFEVYIDGAKLVEDAYSNSSNVITLSSAVSSGTVEIIGYKNVGLETDSTLTLPDAAADAKATGDEINNLKDDLNERVNKNTSSNIFDKSELSVGRLNGNWGNILDWSDFNYSDYIKSNSNVIYFSQCPYEVAFYNNNTRVGIYTAAQLVEDENGWWKTPVFSTLHDGFAFDFPTTSTATYYIDADTLMVGESNLGTEYVPYANYPTLYGDRAALYNDIPTIPSVPEFKTGQTNYFVGKNSGINTTEASSGDNGKYNSAFGVDAFKANTEGDHCTAIGFQAMAKNTTGDGNTACGEDALYENLTGTSNVAVGSHCLQNATKSSNTAVGSSALISQTTGYFNTAIGVQAGRNFGTAENAITTDDRMTLIGGYANKKVPTSLTNSTVIGFQAQADKSNQVVIGNESVVEIVLGSKVLVFNEDGTVTWTSRT